MHNKPVGGCAKDGNLTNRISADASVPLICRQNPTKERWRIFLNITDELPIGGENPRSAQPAGGGKPPQEPRPSTAKMTKAQKKAYKKRNRQKSRRPLALSKHYLVGYGWCWFLWESLNMPFQARRICWRLSGKKILARWSSA